MKKWVEDISEDKRLLALYVVVIVILIIGFTYALASSGLAINVNSAIVQVDTEAYGNTNFDSSNITFSPILDSNVETSLDNVIKIDFTVGGHKNNNASKAIIYDIALTDLKVSCELLSPYVKWKLVKNGTQLSEGSLYYNFDTIKNGRLVLTNIQQDLPDYNASKTGYDNYTFYMWISDFCQDDLSTCASKEMLDQSNLLGKLLSGKIEVELYTGSKKSLTRTPSNTRDDSTCLTSVP